VEHRQKTRVTEIHKIRTERQRYSGVCWWFRGHSLKRNLIPTNLASREFGFYSTPTGSLEASASTDIGSIDLEKDLHFQTYSTFFGKLDWKCEHAGLHPTSTHRLKCAERANH
jgi:hypothetical protein